MLLSTLDWSIIVLFFLISLGIGIAVARQSGKSSADFFLSGRNMSWWLLGISMVATTFSADTPNLVTDIVRKNGIAGNWEWWAFLLTGMLTVFVFAKLWRRSNIVTDLAFYELRYSGKGAAFLRGFRAVYLGIVFNILVMATVCLAAIKIGNILLGTTPIQTLLLASVITVSYSSLGGLKGIILTDFFQFIISMIGTIWAAVYIVNLPEVGGLGALITAPEVQGSLNFLPDFNDRELVVTLLVIPLAVQWWASYYPGAEPGGGGYIVQRMLSAKDEKNAVGATLLFNIAHYALRPWPWILIALASMVVFPDLASIREAFPYVDPEVVNHDLAYPAMLNFLPTGLLGLVIASLIAAFMSTISTHLNWGSSYIVNDVYLRFIKPEATEKELVRLGRWFTVVLMIFAGLISLTMKSAKDAFDIIVLLGAGTGLLFILRWFWWRINAYCEIVAMIVSLFMAILFKLIIPESLPNHWELLISIGVTTFAWVITAFVTSPTSMEVLEDFYKRIKPHPFGWKPVLQNMDGPIPATKGRLPLEILLFFGGICLVYGALFLTGSLLLDQTSNLLISLVFFLIGLIIFLSTLRSYLRDSVQNG